MQGGASEDRLAKSREEESTRFKVGDFVYEDDRFAKVVKVTENATAAGTTVVRIRYANGDEASRMVTFLLRATGCSAASYNGHPERCIGQAVINPEGKLASVISHGAYNYDSLSASGDIESYPPLSKQSAQLFGCSPTQDLCVGDQVVYEGGRATIRGIFPRGQLALSVNDTRIASAFGPSLPPTIMVASAVLPTDARPASRFRFAPLTPYWAPPLPVKRAIRIARTGDAPDSEAAAITPDTQAEARDSLPIPSARADSRRTGDPQTESNDIERPAGSKANEQDSKADDGNHQPQDTERTGDSATRNTPPFEDRRYSAQALAQASIQCLRAGRGLCPGARVLTEEGAPYILRSIDGWEAQILDENFISYSEDTRTLGRFSGCIQSRQGQRVCVGTPIRFLWQDEERTRFAFAVFPNGNAAVLLTRREQKKYKTASRIAVLKASEFKLARR